MFIGRETELKFLHTKYRQSAACKVFKTNSTGGYTRKTIYLRIYRLGKGLPRNP